MDLVVIYSFFYNFHLEFSFGVTVLKIFNSIVVGVFVA